LHLWKSIYEYENDELCDYGVFNVLCVRKVLAKSVSCAVVLAICSGCDSVEPPQGEPAVQRVIAVRASSSEIVDYDEFIGRTEASATVEVRARVSGYLESVDFDDGGTVEAGQLLATIEPDEYQAIYQQSLSNIDLWKAKLELAQMTFARSEDLIRQNTISQAEFDEDLAAVKEAEAQIVAATADADRTALDVKYTKILAPISGRIDRAFITPGNMVTGGLGTGTLLTRIVTNQPMYAYFDVDERSLLRYLRKSKDVSTDPSESPVPLRDLKIPCFLSLQDEQDFPHVGVLDFAENRVDSATSSIRLRGLFENRDSLLQGGLFVRVRIPSSEPYQAVTIPEQCIGNDQGTRYAYVINQQGEAEQRTLELGKLQGKLRVVRRGIEAGENVVLEGIQRMRPGLKVEAEVRESNTPP
jgi:RND family efflux transporter MFP subunit